ncbi:MAG: glycosyltransferase [Candidatus Competibacter sp.]|nr:glycosyltransferase [Candidatus Competibacter sp.]
MTFYSKKIAILLPDLRGGGAERMRVMMAREWLARGFEVDFVLRQRRGELLELVPKEARVIDLGVKRARHVVWPLCAYLRQHKPSILLAAMWPLTTVAILARRLSRQNMRVAVSDHNTLSKSYAGWGVLHRVALKLSMGLIYPFADARIAVSRGVAADLSQLSGISKDRFNVIYNPAANRNNAGNDLVSRPEDLAPNAKILLSVGTLKLQKDHALLIEAFSRMPAHLNAQLCILGEGKQRPRLEQLVREKHLEGKVLMPGFSLNPGAYYQAADLFVLSSSYEGFGNVIVEALEQGVPVVSTDCPSGPREILCDGKYGRLVPVGDADALAQAMQAALQENPDREALKARARDFAVDKIADEYLDVMLPGWNRGLDPVSRSV